MKERAFIAPSKIGGKEEEEGEKYFLFSLGSQAAIRRAEILGRA